MALNICIRRAHKDYIPFANASTTNEPHELFYIVSSFLSPTASQNKLTPPANLCEDSHISFF